MTKVKGRAPTIIASCNGASASELLGSSAPATSRLPITKVRIRPQMIRCLIPVSAAPPDMIVFITRMPESADVTRKVIIRTTHMMVIADKNPPEIIWPSVANSFAVFEAPIKEPAASPFNAAIICARMMNFCGLPVTVIGNSATICTWVGTLKWAILSLQ